MRAKDPLKTLSSPRLRGLNLFTCYIGGKESARRRAAKTAEGIVLDCGKGGIMRFCAETFKATKLR